MGIGFGFKDDICQRLVVSQDMRLSDGLRVSGDLEASLISNLNAINGSLSASTINVDDSSIYVDSLLLKKIADDVPDIVDRKSLSVFGDHGLVFDHFVLL